MLIWPDAGGEGTDGDNLGFREDIIEMIGKSMLEQIFSHSTPEILMDAYTAQLTLLMSHTEFPLLPKKIFCRGRQHPQTQYPTFYGSFEARCTKNC